MTAYFFLFINLLFVPFGKPEKTVENQNSYIYFSDNILDIEPEEKEKELQTLFAYHNDEGLFWLSLNTATYHITRATEIDIEMLRSDCADRWYGAITGGDGYLISGFNGLLEGEFSGITTEPYIFPEPYEFEFSGTLYEFSGTGTYTGQEYNNAKNVTLYFKNKNTGESQILTYIPKLDSNQPAVLFIGDIDGDGKPDFILEQGFNYEFCEQVLYLSSMARKGDLVNAVGMFSMWRDC